MPFSNKLFGGGIKTGLLALNARLEKQGLVQSNIANIETPGYAVQDFNFSTVMKNALQNREPLNRTHQNHIALDPLEVSESMEFIKEDRPVDLDEEMLKLSENQLMYQVTAKIVSKQLEGLRLAIDEGGK